MSPATHFQQTTYLGYLVLPRLAVGYVFLGVGWGKFTRPRFLGTDALAQQLSVSVLKDPISWHREFIQAVVIPHSSYFSYLVCFAEIAIGVSLILGCLTRLASAFGAFYSLNGILTIALSGGFIPTGLNLICIPLFLAFSFAGAGRVLGMDALLRKKYPQSWLF